jgi:hypothetical protein
MNQGVRHAVWITILEQALLAKRNLSEGRLASWDNCGLGYSLAGARSKLPFQICSPVPNKRSLPPTQPSNLLSHRQDAVREEGPDMLVLTGRIQGFMPDIETQKPILGSWGAISGGWALPASLYWVSKCWRIVSKDVPIIGTNGSAVKPNPEADLTDSW